MRSLDWLKRAAELGNAPLARLRIRRTLVAAAVLWCALAGAQAPPKVELAAPFVATPESVTHQMLSLAEIVPSDFVVDLGSGDGRLVIAAVVAYKARGGFGVEIDPALVALANDNARRAGVADRVRFYEQDLFRADLSEATVVTVYLLPAAMERLERKLLAELKPGTRVIVEDYPFPTWRPVRVLDVDTLDKLKISGQTLTQLYLYRVPNRR
jgi:protein-L-isoaspartate O-methyltransferase